MRSLKQSGGYVTVILNNNSPQARSERSDDLFIFLADRAGTLGTRKFLGYLKGGSRVSHLGWIDIRTVWAAYAVGDTIVTKIFRLVQPQEIIDPFFHTCRHSLFSSEPEPD